MRRIIIRSLEAIGVSGAAEAGDGHEGLAKFQAGKFDLVLTDWNMPGKTGPELARDIRQTGSTVPIIMITTEAERARVVEAIQAGVSDYLIKPFQADALREKLNRFVPN